MLRLDRRGVWVFTAATAAFCLNAATRLDAEEAKVTASAWPEADALFRRDPRWLGADGAATVDLGDGRILWLFSDTFIGNKPGATRFDATMVRNSVAIQSHADPTTAEFKAFWNAEGERPASFFADDGQEWFWPGDGELVDGKLIVFMMRVERKEGGLGFKVLDWTARLIDNPLEPPSKWSPRPVETPTNSFGAKIGFGTVIRDGDYLYAYAPAGPTHAIYVVRWPITQVLAGDLTQPEWWSPADAAWRPHRDLTGLPEPMIDHGQAEFTVHLDAAKQRYLQVQTAFFPIGPLALRTAPSLTGPWSSATNFYDPPELSGAPKGFYMYSAKAHLEIAAAGDLAVTYCTNLHSIYDTVRSPDIYYPRFVRVRF